MHTLFFLNLKVPVTQFTNKSFITSSVYNIAVQVYLGETSPAL